jgi:DNA modification methylase
MVQTINSDPAGYRKGIAKPGDNASYMDFLKAKVCKVPEYGFQIDQSEIHPILKDHQKAMVQWAVTGGRRAIFAAFGLGKSVIQLEVLRLIQSRVGGRALIVAPLGVRQEFKRDAQMLGLDITFIRRTEEAGETGLYITNYESVRDGKLDPNDFKVVSLDEASVLRGFGGTKTFREFMRLFETVPYRFVATATPSPNEYIELLAYSAFLGIMDVGQAKTRFFKRNSEKADQLTIHPHKVREFWLWTSSWALFVQRPSDLGYSDDEYSLPEMKVFWHEVLPLAADEAGERRDGQRRMFRDAALGLSEAAREKRDTLGIRIEKMQELLSADTESHFLLWHDLEAERHAIEKAVPSAVSIYGSQDLEQREESIIAFSDGKIKYLAAKPVIAGSGCNFQRYCHKAIFLGIGFKFNDFIQAVHRVYRFLQKEEVEIHLIYAESEREVRRKLERKWNQDKEMRQKMSEIIKEYGLSVAAMTQALTRALGVERVEISGDTYKIVNNDCVVETKSMESASVGLIITSIPFSTQYEYSPNYADFGHSDDNSHFFEQMDYLTPELFRVLQPGRLCAIHVKDRIVPGGLTGLGFQTVYPFHVDCIEHYTKHGFAYMGMKTIVTDVVRENNQTYRLGWTEQCKDGSKMGVGMPEYLLIFRKPPTSSEKSYADLPVVKEKSKYSRSRWQIDAHGFTRSSGNRLLMPEEVRELPYDTIFQMFRDYSLHNVYDFEHHVKVGEALEAQGKLPVTFMLLQPQSWHPDVWTDITRMLTLNGAQAAKGKELHLCPLQFDIVDRAIEQWTMEGETVLDPFGGLMTVPYRAILKRRYGIGIELNPSYFIEGANYCKAAEYDVNMPSLFDTVAND